MAAMRFGILRNIAGNIEAFQDADRRFDEIGVDAKVCLGQIVGIYPYVDNCVELLLAQKYTALRQLVEDEFVGDCRFEGWSTAYLVEALKFVRDSVSANTVEFLKQLPKRAEINGIGFEGLAEGDGFLYRPEQVAAAFASWKQCVVIHAAEPDPYVWRESAHQAALFSGRNQLDPGGRLLISTGGAGSIYQGSANTKQPAAIVFNDEDRTVHLLRPMCDAKIFAQLRKTDYPRGPLEYLEKSEYEVWRNFPVENGELQ
jgi:hypothetical protein